jgi:hypothetical protein
MEYRKHWRQRLSDTIIRGRVMVVTAAAARERGRGSGEAYREHEPKCMVLPKRAALIMFHQWPTWAVFLAVGTQQVRGSPLELNREHAATVVGMHSSSAWRKYE